MLLNWHLLAVCTSLCSVFGETITEKSHSFIEHEEHHENSTNNNNNNGTDNCFCFDKDNGSSKVPEIIDNYGYGVERLIIYLYKDRVTNSAVIHIPDKDRQKVFPDLEIRDDDNLRYRPGSNLEYLFDSDSNAIIVNGNKHKDPAKDNAPKKIDRQDDEDNLFVKPNSKYNKKQKKHYPYIPARNQNKYKFYGKQYQPRKNNPVTTVLWSKPRVFTDEYYNYLKNNNELKTSSSEEDNSEQNQDEFPTFVPNETSNLNIIKHNPIRGTNFNNDNTLNKWIQSEINTLNTYKGNSKNVDPEALKIKVLRILKQNGIRENPQGGLTDSDGLLIDMSNLRLRNVYVGGVVNYNRLVNRVSEAVELPQDSNLIKILMISLLYPPKVLGMIPLGKVTAPIDKDLGINKHGKRKFRRLKKKGVHDEKLYIVSSSENTNNIRNLKMRNELKKIKSRGGRDSFLDFPLQMFRNVAGQFIPGLNDENSRRSGSNRDSLDEAENVNDNIEKLSATKNNDATNYRRNNDVVVPSFYKYSKTRHRHRNTDSVSKKPLGFINKYSENNGFPWETIPGFDYDDDSDIKKDPRHSLHAAHGLSPKQIKKLLHNKYSDVSGFSESEQPFGDPDFRIIGGTPATFSGAPISNRGRSGFIIKP